MEMTGQPYMEIHHWDGSDKTVLDDDGDPRFGWYYQLMTAIEKPMTALMGPYGSSRECESAAIREWVTQ